MPVDLSLVAQLLEKADIHTHVTSGGIGVKLLVADNDTTEVVIGPGYLSAPGGPIHAERKDLSICHVGYEGEETQMWQCSPAANEQTVAAQVAIALTVAARPESQVVPGAADVLTATAIRDGHIGWVAVLVVRIGGQWHPATTADDDAAAVWAVVHGYEIVKRPQKMQLISFDTDQGQVVGVTGSRRFHVRHLVKA